MRQTVSLLIATVVVLGMGCLGAGPDVRYSVSLHENGGEGLVYVLVLEEGRPVGEQVGWRAEVATPPEAEAEAAPFADAYSLVVMKNGILLDDDAVFPESSGGVAVVLWESVTTGTEFRRGDVFQFVVASEGRAVHTAEVLISA